MEPRPLPEPIPSEPEVEAEGEPALELLPPDEEREALVAEGVEELRERTGIDLRLGWELTPIPELLDEDPRRYALEDLDVVLMEVPFTGSADLLVALAEHVEAAGLTPLIAHPERTEAVLERPSLAV